MRNGSTFLCWHGHASSGRWTNCQIGTWEVDTPVKEVVPAQDLATGWLLPYGLPTV